MHKAGIPLDGYAQMRVNDGPTSYTPENGLPDGVHGTESRGTATAQPKSTAQPVLRFCRGFSVCVDAVLLCIHRPTI